MSKKLMVSRYESVELDGLTIKEAIERLGEIGMKCGADATIDIDYGGHGAEVNYKSEETDKEYANRIKRQEHKKNTVEIMERSQLATLVERYGADGGIK